MKQAALKAFIYNAAFCLATTASAAQGGGLCEREMVRAAQRFDVPLAILYAVGMTESGSGGALEPYALNIEGVSIFPASIGEALGRFKAARQSGSKLIDIGCMQINHYFHGARFESVDVMFDPRRNVEYAAMFLRQLREKEGSWTLAAARYHAGPGNNPAQKKYVCRVISNMVRGGFGAWTRDATEFCA